MPTTAWTIAEPQFEELEGAVAFLAIASRLRPRLRDVLGNWDAGETTVLARDFMSSKYASPEALYSALLIKLLAIFERYLRGLLEHSLTRLERRDPTYARLPESIRNHHMRLTGKVLASMDEPRDHLAIDPVAIITNLASCLSGKQPFQLNAIAFSAEVTGAGPRTLERALHLLDVKDFWDDIGATHAVAETLGTKGARATGTRARERLKEVSRWRNQLAHGSDLAIILSEAQLRDALGFIRVLTNALDAIVTARFG